MIIGLKYTVKENIKPSAVDPGIIDLFTPV
jgi:hypothetical protein